jgi:histone acetyltransferase MYST1
MRSVDATGKSSGKSSVDGDMDGTAVDETMNDPFSDALCVGEVVIAYLPTHGRWKHASVVDVRRRRQTPDFANPLSAFTTSSTLKSEEVFDGPEAFDYYVHYHKMNRRHDRWISWTEIRLITDEDSGGEEEEDDDQFDGSSEGSETSNRRPKKFKDEDDGGSSDLPSELEYSDESDHEGMNENDIIEWEKATKVKRIDKILIGGSVMETWYWSPYPTEFQDCSLLYICEYCLSFFREKIEFQWHSTACKCRHPPGDEIYCDPTTRISVFEVDGFFERVYCENLCYLSKLFLDHKRFDRFDVSNFYFYVIGEWLEGDAKSSSPGFRIIGYFSKEKQSTNRNLSCIMSLPCYQRRGFGSFIIEFSYEISKIAKKMGTPERPLSDLGKRTYLRWWLQRILRVLRDRTDPISIAELSRLTYVMQEDIKMTLEEYKLLYYYKGQYHIAMPADRLKLLWIDDNPNHVRVNPVYLHWTPLELPDPNVEL